MIFQTLEQKRARFAYESVSKVKEEKSEIQKKYSSYVKSSPVMILSNGLANTLAFYLSKMKLKDDTDYKIVLRELENYKNNQPNKFENKSDRIAYAYLYTHISVWLAKKSNDGKGLTEGYDPLKYIIEKADVFKVMQLTQEATALLNWMKRFADAMLEKEKEVEY